MEVRFTKVKNSAIVLTALPLLVGTLRKEKNSLVNLSQDSRELVATKNSQWLSRDQLRNKVKKKKESHT